MSQRDSIPKPGVARNELPRVGPSGKTYLEEVVDGVVPRIHPGPTLHNTFGVGMHCSATRGSSFLATPG
jgi:hypothetical protein